jgi:DNA gyrase subunit B
MSGAPLDQPEIFSIRHQPVEQLLERRGHLREAIEALLDADAHDKSFFDSEATLNSLAKQLTTATSVVTVQPDEENKSFSLAIEDRSNGYTRHNTISLDFVTSPDYRTLLNSYREIRDIKPPMTIVTTSAAADQEVERPVDEDQPAGSDRGAEQPGTPIAASKTDGAKKDATATINTLEELLEYFINAGKKGVAINRYKGLGEMNPEQLWTTTMNPEGRTLLQVRAEDHTEADQMFTTLMGDQVEPRRKFIEDNALDVRNLDI